MPIIGGQKMACAPCIRGHRSTKCTHADERVMVPVQKPGRPLKCACDIQAGGNLTRHRDNDVDERQIATVLSEVAGSTYPIDRIGYRPGSLTTKPSLDSAGSERMNASQGYFMPPPVGPDQRAALPLSSAGTPTTEKSNQASTGGPALETPLIHLMYHVIPPLMLPNGRIVPGIAQPCILLHKKHACCDAEGHGNPSEFTAEDINFNTSGPEPTGNQKAKSCCLSQRNFTSPDHGPFVMSASAVPPSETGISSYPASAISKHNNLYPCYCYQSIMLHAQQYSSFAQPFPLEQRKHMAAPTSATHNTTPIVSYAAPGHFQQQKISPSALQTHSPCGCSGNCQCIGCSARAYNEAVQSFVRTAWESKVEMLYSKSDGSRTQTNANGRSANDDAIQTNGP